MGEALAMRTMGALIACMGAICASHAAFAETATSTIEVSVMVQAQCSITTQDISFGSYNPGSNQATADINVNCTAGAPYTISLDAGLHPDGDRRLNLAGSESYIRYSLHQNRLDGPRWDVGVNHSGTGTGGIQTVKVYGAIPNQVDIPSPGLHSDTVTVTINF